MIFRQHRLGLAAAAVLAAGAAAMALTFTVIPDRQAPPPLFDRSSSWSDSHPAVLALDAGPDRPETAAPGSCPTS